MRAEFQFATYAPVVFLSALTKKRIHTLMPEILKVKENIKTRKEKAAEDKYIDQSQIKIVKRLLITDIKTNNVIEDIKYSDDFIVSDGVK